MDKLQWPDKLPGTHLMPFWMENSFNFWELSVFLQTAGRKRALNWDQLVRDVRMQIIPGLGCRRSTQREPTQANGEHANSMQKAPGWDSNPQPLLPAAELTAPPAGRSEATHFEKAKVSIIIKLRRTILDNNKMFMFNFLYSNCHFEFCSITNCDSFSGSRRFGSAPVSKQQSLNQTEHAVIYYSFFWLNKYLKFTDVGSLWLTKGVSVCI